MLQRYFLLSLLIPLLTLVAGAQTRDIVWIKGGAPRGITALQGYAQDHFFAAGADGTITSWNMRTMTFDSVLARDVGEINDMDRSYSGKLLVAAGKHGVVNVWDLERWTLLRRFGPFNQEVLAVRFSRLEDQLAYVLADGSMGRISMKTWSPINSEAPLGEPVAAAAIDQFTSSVVLASAVSDSIWVRGFSRSHVVRMRGVRRGGTPIVSYAYGAGKFVFATQPSLGSYRIVLASDQSETVLAECDLGGWKPLLLQASIVGFTGIVDSAGTMMLLSWSLGDSIPKLITRLPMGAGGRRITSLIDAGNQGLVLGGYERRQYGDIPDENEYPLLEVYRFYPSRLHVGLTAHRDGVRSLEFLDSKDMVVSGGGDPELKLWDRATGLLADSVRYDTPVLGMQLSPGGEHLLLHSKENGNPSGGVWLYDLLDGGAGTLQKTRPDLVSARAEYTARVDSAGPVVLTITASDTVITLGPERFNRLGRFSGNGHWLAWHNDDGRIRFCNLASREITDMLESFPRGTVLAISEDGERVALATAEGRLGIWERQGGALLATMQAHTGRVNALAFSPEGKFLISAGDDGLVKIWDALFGVNTYTYADHQVPYLSLAISSDAKHIAAGTADGTVVLRHARGPMAAVAYRQSEAEMLGALPNPSSGPVTVTVAIKHSGVASISIVNAAGDEIERLLEEYLEPGEQRVIWEASKYPAGIYFCRLRLENQIESIPVVLVR